MAGVVYVHMFQYELEYSIFKLVFLSSQKPQALVIRLMTLETMRQRKAGSKQVTQRIN